MLAELDVRRILVGLNLEIISKGEQICTSGTPRPVLQRKVQYTCRRKYIAMYFSSYAYAISCFVWYGGDPGA